MSTTTSIQHMGRARAPIFVDTAYFVALLNRRDTLHPVAVSLASDWLVDGSVLLTTDAVLIELGNFFARSPLRTAAIGAISQIRHTQGWTVDRIAASLLDRAESRYGAHPDKSWSVTDCLSMEAMLSRGVTDIATSDHHFTQAGFRILMGFTVAT